MLELAAATRGSDVKGVIIFHSDRGSEGVPALPPGLPASGRDAVHGPGRVGSCFDNTACEAFNSVLKVEF
ncbi:transposase InsO family protein [Streptomyces aurantiacus]|nr:transposase InsO family protein [Streptomyces aurantiacus]